MNQDQTIDNDLQKAIDSITNETNIDPVFSDPVAAPSSIPEGDTGELGEPIGPFTTPNIETPLPNPALTTPAFGMPTPTMPDSSVPLPSPDPIPAPIPPASDSFQPIPSEPAFAPVPGPLPEPAPEPAASAPSSTNLNMHQVKEAALRDLVPLIDRLNMSPSQRFNICRSIFEDLRDYTVLEQAYRSASEIPDPTERAEALLYLVESIDRM